MQLHSADQQDIVELGNLSYPVFDIIKDRELSCESGNVDKTMIYVLNLEGGILNCNQPLMSNTEVKLSFDRALASIGLLYRNVIPEDGTPPLTMQNKPIDLIDPYMEVEYVSSPYLRNFYSQIVERPIKMRYDDTNICLKTISKGQSMIRVNNIMGGLTPDYLFAGLVKTDAMNGDFELSSTKFFDPGYREVNITLNGINVQGFPITVHDETVKLYSKFIDVIGKSKKTFSGSSLNAGYFNSYYCLIAHAFEGEQSNEGWIGLDFKLKEALADDVTLGIEYLLFQF